MNEIRAKITENGRIVIPAEFRKLLHLDAGDEVILRIENDELHLFSLKHSLKKAQSLVSQHTKNKSLVKALKNMRNEDNKHE